MDAKFQRDVTIGVVLLLLTWTFLGMGVWVSALGNKVIADAYGVGAFTTALIVLVLLARWREQA